MHIIAVLPARNEASRIGDVISKIKRVTGISRIIVVDDASDDNTSAVASGLGAHVIRLRQHGGVGTATRTGLRAALHHDPDAIIFLDADGQHDPRYISNFIRQMKSGADFVIGKRDLSRYPLMKRFGNFMLHWLTEMFSPTGIRDPECGFRAISAKAAKSMDLRAKHYEICMDFVYNVWKNKLRVKQTDIMVPMYYSKKGTTIRTGIANFRYLVKRRFLG